MKLKSIFSLPLSLVAGAALLASCSGSKEQAFAKRKYLKHFAKEASKHELQKGELLASAGAFLPEERPQLAPLQQPAGIDHRLLKRAEFTAIQPQKAETAERKPYVAQNHSPAPVTAQSFEWAPVEEVQMQQPVELTVLEVIVAIIPPLAMAIFDGRLWPFLLNLLLTLILWLPGFIHAIIVLSKT